MKKIKKYIRLLIDSYKKIKVEERLKKEFENDIIAYNSLTTSESEKINHKYLFPCLYDKTQFTEIDPIYFYQDSWAFEKIYHDKPAEHYDIGSQHVLVSMISKITKLTMIDIRPLSLPLETIHFVQGDITKLPFPNKSLKSLSSLCVIEHIGLGRYGDTIDPKGSEKAFKEIDRVLDINALFYFSVPVTDDDRIYYNAHRSFCEKTLFEKYLSNYDIIDKMYIAKGSMNATYTKGHFNIGCYKLKKVK